MMDVESHRATARPFTFHFLVHVHLLGRVAHLDDVVASLQAKGGGASGSAKRLQQSTANVEDADKLRLRKREVKHAIGSVDLATVHLGVGHGANLQELVPNGHRAIRRLCSPRNIQLHVSYGYGREDRITRHRRNGPPYGHAAQACTPTEGTTLNLRHTGGDRDIRQGCATPEGVLIDLTQAERERGGLQGRTAVEGTLVDIRQASRGERDGGQGGTAREGTLFNLTQAEGQRDGGQGGTVRKGAVAHLLHTLRQRNGTQRGAIEEHSFFDFSHANRERNGRQGRAIRKGVILDLRHASGDLYRGQGATPCKSVLANACDTAPDND